MRLDLHGTGEVLRASAGQLTRVWRATRLEARPEVFPGVIDGVIEEFLARAGEALLAGHAPEEAWASARGVIRLLPGERALEELAAEWRLAGEVLASACAALDAEPAAADRVAEAVEAARRAANTLRDGRPHGILLIYQLAGFRQRSDPRADGPR